MHDILTIIFCLVGREKYLKRNIDITNQLGAKTDYLIIKELYATMPEIPASLHAEVIDINQELSGMHDIFYSINKVSEKIKCYKFCHFVEDDNFIFPNSVHSLIKNLDKDKMAITGKAVIYNKTGPKEINQYYLSEFSKKNVIERIKEYNLKGGLVYYSIFRSDFFLNICAEIKNCSDDYLCEMLFNYLTVIDTQVEKVNKIYMCREYPRPKVYNIPNNFEWFIQKDLSKEINIALEIIKRTLIKKIKIDNEEIFDLTVGNYISKRFNQKRKKKKVFVNSINKDKIEIHNYLDKLEKFKI